MRKTALFDRHQQLHARMASFAGWEMPIRYEKGTLVEHQAVREAAGLFDVSHMGRIFVRGPEAEALLDYLSTNRIVGSTVGKATYTVWPNERGGAVDDLIVYHQAENSFFVIVNAGNREKDLQHLQYHAQNFDVTIEARYNDDGILALQGPKAPEIMAALIPEATELKMMRLATYDLEGQPVVIARTGYTGEKGYELIAGNTLIPLLWDRIMEIGGPLGIEPVGLGARDTLRLEMGFALYGHELSDDILINETVSSWTIRRKDRNFLGKDALDALAHPRKQYGVVIEDRGIPREGYPVLKEGKVIGSVTSGNQSPTLGVAIAIILVDQELAEGDGVEIEIRKKTAKASVVGLPFLKTVKKQEATKE